MVKVGFQTGRTEGTIRDLLGDVFSVVPKDPSPSISENGDSGAAWVTLPDATGHVKWVGVHRGRLSGQNVAVGFSYQPIVQTIGFQPF